MRKNIQAVFTAFIAGRSLTVGSVSTDGDTLFSYATPMVSKMYGGLSVSAFAVNTTKYSPTTSQHQASLRALLTEHIAINALPCDIIQVGGLPFGCSRRDLRDRADDEAATRPEDMTVEQLYAELTHYTMNDIENACPLFFSKSAMRFFNSRILDGIYQATGGVYFVTSERYEQEPRNYRVRRFDPVLKSIDTVGGPFRHYTTAGQARKEAQRLAEGK